jgi:hypothetical protein
MSFEEFMWCRMAQKNRNKKCSGKYYGLRMTIRNQVQRNIKSKSNRFRFNLPVPSPREKVWDEVFY